MQVGFEGRSPVANDEIRLGIIDTEGGDTWREIGRTTAWNWQQGAMLQWLPGSPSEVIWNERRKDGYAAVIYNVKTGRRRALTAPIYALSPDGRSAVAPDFRRLNDCRPGYGYSGIADPNAAQDAPEDAGIWQMDLKSGRTRLLIPFSRAAAIPHTEPIPKGSKHWFNHLLYSTDGSRFIFLHRWRRPGEKPFNTRMFTAAADGTDLYVLDPYGRTSHFIWRDPTHVLAWAWHPSHGEKFYLYTDRTQQVDVVAPDAMVVNGHCTYLPGNRYILNDTYPDRERLQHVYLYDTAQARRIPVGDFLSPAAYSGEWRCDTHPRFSPDGRKVIIDSPHAGGRQMYLIDISSVAGNSRP
jgi:hypothetical protein